MSHKLLLSNKYKKIGWCILIPATILGIVLMFTDFDGMQFKVKVFALFAGEIFGKDQPYFSFIYTNITNTIIGVLFIIGALLICFSKEKTEDEFISNLRLSSLLWSVFVNYVLLLISFVFIYGTAFLYVMLYNMFTVLIIFIIRFNYVVYRNSKSASDEK